MDQSNVKEMIRSQLLKHGFVLSDNHETHIVELLDSITLVDFVMDLQDSFEQSLGKPVHIMSDKAFSRSSSPFRTVETLTEYMMELL